MKKGIMHTSLKWTLVIVLLLTIPAMAQMRGRQAGDVKDEAGNPIEGALVIMEKEKTSAGADKMEEKTDASGEFIFTGLNPGTWTLTVQKPGYAPVAMQLKISSISKNENLEITLKKMEAVGGGDASKEAQGVIAEGKKLVENGKYDEAVALYEDFYSKYPSATAIYAYVGEALLAKGDTEGALGAFQVVLDEDPDNATALKALGDHFVKKADYAKALEYYKPLAEVEATNAGIQFIAAEVANSASDWDAAIKYYERFLALESTTPNAAQALLTVGYIYTTTGDCDKAEERFKQFLELSPDPATEQALMQEVENCRNK